MVADNRTLPSGVEYNNEQWVVDSTTDDHVEIRRDGERKHVTRDDVRPLSIGELFDTTPATEPDAPIGELFE